MISLAMDWDAEFPFETVQIKNITISIRPMGIRDLFEMSGTISTMVKELMDYGINEMNWSSEDSMVKIVSTVLTKASHFISLASGISEKDFNRLPAAYQFSIIAAIINVNLRDWEVFSKNFQRLTKSLQGVVGVLPEEFKSLVTSFSSSLKTAILGQTLSGTV